MTRPERRWCIAYSIALILVTTLPIWIAFRAAGDSWSFSGFLVAVEDGNSYIAKMNLGSAGAWLFRSPYSAAPQRGVLAFLPYLLLGKLAAGPEQHLQQVLLLQIFRIATIPLEILATYKFTAMVSESTRTRRWATVLATAGGGLGWVLAFTRSGEWLGSLPLDFISPESFGFLAILTLPHLVLTRALILFALANYLADGESGRTRWWAGLLLGLSTLVQPLGTLSAMAVVAAHQLVLWLRNGRSNLRIWRSRWWPAAWHLMVPSLPLLLYYALSSWIDPYLQIWSAQNQLPSPHPLHYLLAYGLVLPFALRGAYKAWRNSSSPGLLLMGWLIILPLLAYFPYPVQRRLPDGVWVALSILAIDGLSDWLAGRPVHRWLRAGLVGICTISSLAIVVGSIQSARHPARPAFIPSGDERAFQWLRNHVDPGSIVLASYETSNALPAWAPVRVIIGLGPESAGQEELLPQVDAFYRGMPEGDRRQFMRQHDIQWIFFGPLERKLGSLDPAEIGLVSLKYSESGYQIYLVGGDS